MKQIYYAIQSILHGRGSNVTKVISLSLGLTIGILLFSQIAFELNYEKCYPEADRLVLVRGGGENVKTGEKGEGYDDSLFAPMAEAFRSDYVLKNMKFIFDKTNQSYFHRLYDKAFREGGWRAVPRLTWHMIYRNKRLDDNGPMGASLITLNQRHPDDAFQKYIETTNHHIMVSEPRLADGTIARLWPHENTIWADDAFMAVSFISRMGEVTGEKKYFDDAANQILNYTRYLWCPEKQIYYHCYHTDNKEHGVAHWSRANGWIFMATADLLARMPKNHPMREDVIKNFQMQASGVARYQGKNGLWHQLLDKEDSYEEITGSSMFVFGIAKGVKEGWLHPDFIYVAWQGLKGMLSKISENGDVTAICVGTGIMPSSVFYYNRPTQENDPMGEGPVLRALVEMIDAPKYTEISANDQYDKIK